MLKSSNDCSVNMYTVFDPGNPELCWFWVILRLFALEDNFYGRVSVKIPGRISSSVKSCAALCTS